jgi:hypothetical protein
MSQLQTITGVGHLYRGQRNLGCVWYRLEMMSGGQMTTIEFDPVPDGGQGDIFSLHLSDGRILECQAAERCQFFRVMGDGPHAERRVSRRLSAVPRLLA